MKASDGVTGPKLKMIQSEKDPNVWSTVPHGGSVVLTAEDVQHPLRGETKIFSHLDECAFIPFSQVELGTGHIPELAVTAVLTGEITITLPAVPSATEYRIYTGHQWESLAEVRRRNRVIRKALNKRKKSARARTGRR